MVDALKIILPLHDYTALSSNDQCSLVRCTNTQLVMQPGALHQHSAFKCNMEYCKGTHLAMQPLTLHQHSAGDAAWCIVPLLSWQCSLGRCTNGPAVADAELHGLFLTRPTNSLNFPIVSFIHSRSDINIHSSSDVNIMYSRNILRFHLD